MRVDPTFEAGHFLTGARSAYELIVTAFAQGDRQRAAQLGGCAAACAEGSELIAPDARALRRLAASVDGEPGWTVGRGMSVEQGVAVALREAA